MAKNNAFVKSSYNFAIAETYTKEIRALIRQYYTLVSDGAIDAFINNGNFAELTAEELLLRSGFDLRFLERKTQKTADRFVETIQLQVNAKFREGYKEAGKRLPKPLIKPRQYDKKTRNLITQQVQKIKGLQTYQYTRINEALQENIAKGGTLGDFKKSLQEAKIYNEKRINTIAKNQLTYATTVVYKDKALDLGLDDATWQRPKSDIYKTKPRAEHVKADGRKFKLSKGLRLKNDQGKMQRILPGELINCECYYLFVI
jgi:hypothetical protein